MYCRALACDFDGTGATNGRLAPEVASILAEARTRGIVTMLVTGRVLEDLRLAEVDLGAFDAVVGENGAIVLLPGLGRTIQLAEPPPEHFLGELRSRGVPVQFGAVIVATWEAHTSDVLDVIRRLGMDAQIIFNRGAVMVLPSGVNKAVGTRRALLELGRSRHNLIAFGDAENDLPLLAQAEIGVAARGSVPSVAGVADERLAQPGPSGVATYLRRLLEHGGIAPTPRRHRLVLGCDCENVTVEIPASGADVMITGDPRAGKSWLAGLVAEQLIEIGYRLCIVDPEGDHALLGRHPAVLVFGDDLALPAASVVPQLMRSESLSVVLNLSRLDHEQKRAYVEAALSALEASRAASGIPHWIVVDEAHYFFAEGSPRGRHFDSRAGNYVFATYRPSLMARAVHASVGAHLLTPTLVDEERYFMTSLLQARAPSIDATDALGQVGKGSVGLLLNGGDHGSWRVFEPGARVCPHTRHLRKYVDTRLPADRAFYFRDAGDAQPAVAYSVGEFAAAVNRVPITSLAHHLNSGDFSRWAEGVLGDRMLAAGFRKLEQVVHDGAPPSRTEILKHITARYHLAPGSGLTAQPSPPARPPAEIDAATTP